MSAFLANKRPFELLFDQIQIDRTAFKFLPTRFMKKVLFVFDRVAHYHRELFKLLEAELPQHGIELHLLSGETTNNAAGRVGLKTKVVQNEAKYRFYEYKVRGFTLRRTTGVVERVLDLRPDIVVCMGHVGNLTHWKLARLKSRLNYKLVAWQCGYEYNPSAAKASLLRRFVPKFDHHLAYHSNAKAYALQHGSKAEEITLMHNTINEERIACIPKAQALEQLRAAHPEIGQRRILLFVGAVLSEKRVEVIVDALDVMNRQDVVLVVVGDGEHLSALKDYCKGRADVVFTGSIIEGVGPYFDAAEVYLLPGTGGLGINEAMAHSLPIISGFADGSADDLVVDGENGYRLREGTAQELADRIVRVIDDPVEAGRMGRVSRDWITGKFAFRAFIDRIVKALTAVAAA